MLQHLKLTEHWVEQHKILIEQNYVDLGRQRKKSDVIRGHNSSFMRWFKKRQLLEAESRKPSTEDDKLILYLS